MILPLDLHSSYSRLVDIWFWSFVDSQVVFWHFKKQMFVPMHSSIVWPKHAIPIWSYTWLNFTKTVLGKVHFLPTPILKNSYYILEMYLFLTSGFSYVVQEITMTFHQLKNLILPESGILGVNYEIVSPWIVSKEARIFTQYDCLHVVKTT